MANSVTLNMVSSIPVPNNTGKMSFQVVSKGVQGTLEVGRGGVVWSQKSQKTTTRAARRIPWAQFVGILEKYR